MTETEAQRNLKRDDVPVYKFVFTGGPCGGKTTALARVFSYLKDRGFEVIKCPEAYTALSPNGMSAEFFSTEGMALVIQRTVMDTQMTLEDGLFRVLKARGNPGVLLCDRGMMDGSVYLGDEEFAKLMEEQNTDIVQLRDNRYDAVFHLVTAADGAEPFYTLENNQVRTETKEQARHVDKLTQRAWVGHPHLYCIDNSTDFEGKMTRLVDTLSKIVGLPSNLKRRSARFLLSNPPDLSKFPEGVDFQQFEVEKVYLQKVNNDKNHFTFIRRRTSVDSEGNKLGNVYQLTTAHYTEGDNRELIEQKRIISKRECKLGERAHWVA